MVALTAPERFTTNRSFDSAAVSPTTATAIVFRVSPGANVSTPLVATKSDPAAAVSPKVAYDTLTGTVAAADRRTVKTNGVVPAFPSASDTSSIAIAGGGGPCASSLRTVPTPW